MFHSVYRFIVARAAARWLGPEVAGRGSVGWRHIPILVSAFTILSTCFTGGVLHTGCEVPAFGGGGAEPVFQQAAACGGFGVGGLV
jgi:hypothetical protein